jgi:hypothetical protein
MPHKRIKKIATIMTDFTIYSNITKKCYSSEENCKKDVRKFKLEKLNEQNFHNK